VNKNGRNKTERERRMEGNKDQRNKLKRKKREAERSKSGG
jgi:hypothetical protein